VAPVSNNRRVPALKVHQWLDEWNEVQFDAQHHRSEPPEDFFLFSLPASDLRALSGISRRSTEGGVARALDLGIQRGHTAERSDEIKEFVMHGFPWSSLSKQRRDSGEFDNLKKPGWLPTAIVVNVLRPDDVRLGHSVHKDDLLTVRDGDELRTSSYPKPLATHGHLKQHRQSR
jgi:hypothetical protein